MTPRATTDAAGSSRRAAIVGSGPNGLTAACLLARDGWDVVVYESAAVPGGAVRSARVLGDSVVSDLGASAHPMGAVSLAFEDLGLTDYGLEWAYPKYPAAHGLDDEAPVLLHSSLREQVEELGVDGQRWAGLVGAASRAWPQINRAAMSPPTRPFSATSGLLRGSDAADAVVDRLLAYVKLGSAGAWPAALVNRLFREERARVLFTGLAAHATLPLNRPITGAFGVLFAAAGHADGWPMARGGSQAIVDALLACLHSYGGRVVTDFHVDTVRQGGAATSGRGPRYSIAGCRRQGRAAGERREAEAPADVVLLDLSPKQVLELEGLPLRRGYERSLRQWEDGPGVVKVDYLVRSPMPWAHQELAGAGTVHLGGSSRQIAASEAAVHRGVLPGRPYVLLTQPGAADTTRAPEGYEVLWAYAHVPAGLDDDGASRAAQMIAAEIERQAPGFGDAVVASTVWGPQRLQKWNPNLVGGAITGGVPSLQQLLARPAWPGVSGAGPYGTGTAGVYLCSSSTPPGGGAHGMPGYHAARAVLYRYGPA